MNQQPNASNAQGRSAAEEHQTLGEKIMHAAQNVGETFRHAVGADAAAAPYREEPERTIHDVKEAARDANNELHKAVGAEPTQQPDKALYNIKEGIKHALGVDVPPREEPERTIYQTKQMVRSADNEVRKAVGAEPSQQPDKAIYHAKEAARETGENIRESFSGNQYHHSGQQGINDIEQGIKRAAHETEHMMHRARDKADHAVHEVRDKTGHIVHEARDKAETLVDDVKAQAHKPVSAEEDEERWREANRRISMP